MALGQLACEDKSNEIAAIPKLLEALEITGCIVTIDAMGTQTAIAKKIQEKGADYILTVKTNQPDLYEDISLFFDEHMKDQKARSSSYYAKTLSKEHGRFETRECFCYEDIEWLYDRKKGLD